MSDRFRRGDQNISLIIPFYFFWFSFEIGLHGWHCEILLRALFVRALTLALHSWGSGGELALALALALAPGAGGELALAPGAGAGGELALAPWGEKISFAAWGQEENPHHHHQKN
jgi:hypothetical protein